MQRAASARAPGTRQDRDSEADGVTLDALLETEQELSALTGRAEEEGRALVANAEAAARALAEEEAAALQHELVALEQRQREAVERAIAEARAEARADAARFDAMSDAVIAALAEAVLDDFLGTGPIAPAEGSR